MKTDTLSIAHKTFGRVTINATDYDPTSQELYTEPTEPTLPLTEADARDMGYAKLKELAIAEPFGFKANGLNALIEKLRDNGLIIS